MARFVVSAIVGIAAGIVLGPTAGFQAFALTYGLTGFLDPSQQVSGPRIDDLKGTTAEYGTPISPVYGHPRVAGAIVWCSDKREIASTEEAGGKGGPSTEVTTYTYEIDVRILLTANEIAAIRQIWSNGKLIWSMASDADAATLEASANTNAWRRITVYTGAADQMPDPTEEAALGIENCPAYRGRGSVFIEGLNLGGSGFLPNLTFEVLRLANVTTSGDVLLLVNSNGTPGSTAFVDLSSYGHTLLTTNMTQSASAAAYGSATGAGVSALGVGTSAGIGTGLSATAATWSTDESLTIEVSTRLTADPQAAINWGSIAFAGGSPRTSILRQDDFSPDAKRLGFEIAGQQFFGADISGSSTALPAGQVHLELDYDGNTKEATLYVNGDAYVSGTYTGPLVSGPLTQLRCIDIGAPTSTVTADSVGFDGLRITKNRVRHTANFTPPTTEPTLDDSPIYEALDEPLEDVLTDISVRAGLQESYLDFSSCVGQYVRALAVSQVTSSRSVMELLGSAYLQEFVESDTLKTVARGGSALDPIPYEAMGASLSESPEPLPLRRLNDVELPAQVAITYINVLNDYQKGTEYSDRLLGVSTGVNASELALGLTPQEAKRLADVRLTDAVASIVQAGPVGLLKEYAHLEPCDVVPLIGHDGSTYRVRILKLTVDQGVHTIECALDDATVINSAALTDEDYTSSTIVRALVETDLELMDIPILRDADNDAGIYAAVTRSTLTGEWPGAALFRGVNEAGWGEVARYTDRTFIGTTSTSLGAWDGRYQFDEVNTVTVSGVGDLVSYTRAAIINGTANAYLIGDEILFARNASMVTTGTFILSGLLRARRGTEVEALAGHASGVRCVLLQNAGLRRVGFELGQLGTEFDFRAVTLGQTIGSAATESITPMGVGKRPFSPVHIRAQNNGDGTFDVSWMPRTRLSTRLTGAAGIYAPVGEFSESYVVRVYDGSDVLQSTQTVGTNAATVMASSGYTVNVYQVGEVAGRESEKVL